MKSRTRKNRPSAFTLVEMMIATTIAGVALAAATTFYYQTVVGHYIVDQRITQAGVLRRFSQEMIYHASRANQLFLYKSAIEADRDAPGDQLHLDTVSADPDILHPAGDFVVFVYYEIPKPIGQDYHRIKTIVGYYLDIPAPPPAPAIAPPRIGPIRKVTIDLSKNISTGAATLGDQVVAYDTATAKTMVEKVMKDNWANATHTRFEQFVINARGLFESELVPAEGLGRLFYYRDERLSMMIAGQMYGTSFTSNKRTYTDSFCFSITPRS